MWLFWLGWRVGRREQTSAALAPINSKPKEQEMSQVYRHSGSSVQNGYGGSSSTGGSGSGRRYNEDSNHSSSNHTNRFNGSRDSNDMDTLSLDD